MKTNTDSADLQSVLPQTVSLFLFHLSQYKTVMNPLEHNEKEKHPLRRNLRHISGSPAILKYHFELSNWIDTVFEDYG